MSSRDLRRRHGRSGSGGSWHGLGSPVGIGVAPRHGGRWLERGPLAVSLGQPVGNRPDGSGVVSEADVCATHLDVLRSRSDRLQAGARRDHAVLLVKTDEGFVMLDNVGSTPLDASRSHGYRPVMSLGAKQNFLHGY